jgi:hypothetical protein
MVPEFDVAGEVPSAVIETNPGIYVPFSKDMGQRVQASCHDEP